MSIGLDTIGLSRKIKEMNFKFSMTRELFKEVMNEIQKSYDYQEGLNNYFKTHDIDGYIYQPDCMCAALKLLHIYFGEKDSNEWISYFCFELNFGRKYKEGNVLDDNGKSIPLATYDDLYDLLTK
jgi:hypothetical protein